MTRAALAFVGAGAGQAPIEPRGEDRLSAFAAPIREASFAMIAFAAGSLAVHAVLMAAAVVAARTPAVVPPQREIAVEIVPDVPKPAPAKPPPPKVEQAKPEPPKAQPVKSEPAKAPPPPAANRAASPARSAETEKLKAMQDELANLRAEQAALKAARAPEASGKALALPTIGGDGDAVGYQQLVFSQLAKAKGDDEYHGEAGTTAVKFEMDGAGKLVRVEIVRSSGKAALDTKALDIVHRAAPFPPPPTDADRIVFANVNFVPPKTP